MKARNANSVRARYGYARTYARLVKPAKLRGVKHDQQDSRETQGAPRNNRNNEDTSRGRGTVLS